jgi:hypothetical protein
MAAASNGSRGAPVDQRFAQQQLRQPRRRAETTEPLHEVDSTGGRPVAQ